MNQEIEIRSLLRIRFLIACLGSAKAFGWWDCSFLDDTGIRFLANPFPRSAFTAALESTSEAAQRTHDDALGKIGCYHLFRLPLTVEDRLRATGISEPSLPTKDSALGELASQADGAIDAPEGPVQIGVAKKLLTDTSIRELAAHYHSAFTKGMRCYPYFSADA